MKGNNNTDKLFPGNFRSPNTIWRAIIILTESVNFYISLLLLEESIFSVINDMSC